MSMTLHWREDLVHGRSLFWGIRLRMWLRRGDPPRIPYSLRQGSAASAATGLPGRGAAAAPSPTTRDMRGGIYIARVRIYNLHA
jgi:hypothetical protein